MALSNRLRSIGDSSQDRRSGKVETIDTPGYQERVIFSGANGSGKTILASTFLQYYPRVVVLDVKGDFPIPWDSNYQIRSKPPWTGFPNALQWRYGSKRIVYRPNDTYD